MNFNSLIEIIDRKLIERQEVPFNQVEIILLQGIWKSITYNYIGQQENYSTGYLTNVAAPKLYKKLSRLIGKEITKRNCLILLKSYIASLDYNVSTSYPSGAVSLGSPLYLERCLVEKKIYQEISKPGALIRIKASKGMGKTSLLLRILDHVSQQGYRTIVLNCDQIDSEIFSNLNRFLRFLCASATIQLNLESKIDEYWDEDIGSKVSCSLYFRNYLLEQVKKPIVLAFDELNLIFEYPQIAKDVLPLLRSWYEDSKRIPTWQNLRLIVMHSTEVYISLQLNQSPFNVGLPIQLQSFDLNQVKELAEKYQLNWQDTLEAEQLNNLVGGHPELIQIALYHLSREEMTLSEILMTASNPEGIYRNHLRQQWLILQQESKLTKYLRILLKSKKPIQLEPTVAYKLSGMGLIRLIGDKAIISSELYYQYFIKNLTEMNSDMKS